MKDQMPCADYLLSLDNVDVNFPDDCGRTLLCQRLRSSTLDEQLLEKATFLVEKKGADVNKADIEQWTPVKIFVLKRNAFVCSLPDSSTDGFYARVSTPSEKWYVPYQWFPNSQHPMLYRVVRKPATQT